MTQEEKYEEALQRAKQQLIDCGDNQGRKNIIYKIFPELRESENERTRKELIEFIRTLPCTIHVKEEYFHWLEKQGEKKPDEYSLEQAAEIFLNSLKKTPYNNKPVTDAQVITKELLKFLSDTNSYNPDALIEQTDAEWSEEDEDTLDIAIRIIQNGGDNCSGILDSNKVLNWLESLKEKVQPKQEWSEKDEKISDAIYQSIDFLVLKDFGITEDETVDFLKSIKPNHWRPSREQLEALRYELGTGGKYNKEALKILYSDLQKL